LNIGSSVYLTNAAKNAPTPNRDIRVPSMMLKILTLYGRKVAKPHENRINRMPGIIQSKPSGRVTA